MSQARIRLKLGARPDLVAQFATAFGTWPKETATEIATTIKKRIYAQSYPHAPLSPLYLKWKLSRGLDPRILIATGLYAGSIGARQVTKNKWVVAPQGAHHGMSMEQLGLMLEYGTARMPARPHFRVEAVRAQETANRLAKTKLSTLVKRFQRDAARVVETGMR